jgi:hypothetical protein
LAQRLQSPFFFFGRMACQKIQATLGSKPARDALARQFGEGRRHTLELALSITALSLLLAGATLFWARRVHFPWRRAWAWAGFVLLFNLAGFITFRLAADWPRLVGCPRCGRSRPVDTASCPHCGQGWPGNELTGTEIFDSEPVEALDARA